MATPDTALLFEQDSHFMVRHEALEIIPYGFIPVDAMIQNPGWPDLPNPMHARACVSDINEKLEKIPDANRLYSLGEEGYVSYPKVNEATWLHIPDFRHDPEWKRPPGQSHDAINAITELLQSRRTTLLLPDSRQSKLLLEHDIDTLLVFFAGEYIQSDSMSSESVKREFPDSNRLWVGIQRLRDILISYSDNTWTITRSSKKRGPRSNELFYIGR